jgi:preprotein translocase subunit Sec61beta
MSAPAHVQELFHESRAKTLKFMEEELFDGVTSEPLALITISAALVILMQAIHDTAGHEKADSVVEKCNRQAREISDPAAFKEEWESRIK